MIFNLWHFVLRFIESISCVKFAINLHFWGFNRLWEAPIEPQSCSSEHGYLSDHDSAYTQINIPKNQLATQFAILHDNKDDFWEFVRLWGAPKGAQNLMIEVWLFLVRDDGISFPTTAFVVTLNCKLSIERTFENLYLWLESMDLLPGPFGRSEENKISKFRVCVCAYVYIYIMYRFRLCVWIYVKILCVYV